MSNAAKISEQHANLCRDYQALCEKYQDVLPVYEFGYSIIRFTSQMLFDTAPSEGLAYRTILAGVEAGNRESKAAGHEH